MSTATRPPKRQRGGRADGGALALRFFDQVLFAPSWAAWRGWLAAVFGLPMTEAEAATFRACTARTTLPVAPCREVWTIAGRRSGKSRMAALLVAFLGGVKKWTLAPGETPVVLVITPSRRQAAVILDYAEAFLQMLPGVSIVRRTLDTIELGNRVSIQVQSASFRTPRGFTAVACICDEIAFWRSDDSAANPDTEILRAVRPSLASVPGSLLVAISSPYAARGELFRNYERHFGKDSDAAMVWQASSVVMNPSIPQGLVDQAMADDPGSASAEWLGQFRSDLESLYAREALDQVVIRGRHELPPVPGVGYTGFVDPSGGSADSFTLAVAHRTPGGTPALDLVREVRPPFSPEAVTLEFSRDLKRYNINKVIGDRYGGAWVSEQFKRFKIEYETAELTRSELYLELLPMVNSGTVELLDHGRTIGQLAGLERVVGRTGRDSVEHRRGTHDDVANAAAGALVFAIRSNAHATLPASFCSCNRAASMPDFSLRSCYLFFGAFRPPGDEICRNCEGHRFVLQAAQAYRERSPGEPVHYVTFYREHIEANELVSRVRANAWADSQGL